jgi:adenine-specific DNA-methyltransferase
MKPYYKSKHATLYHGDALEALRALPDNSVDAVVTDPPYFKVKNLAWDRQWDKPQAFLAWVGELCDRWRRVLKPNGSLYCFASPKMAARVEVVIGERFNVLNSIVWRKFSAEGTNAGPWMRAEKEGLRAYFDQTERIIFAEHYGADNIAEGEAGYAAKCDELRGFVFEPLRAYLDAERVAAMLTPEDCNEICGHRREGGMAGRHYFSASQFWIPTAANYAKLQAATGRFQRPHEDLRREYEDLRREYEDLRREYEDLRRPFSVTAEVPYTDVWDFATVQAYKGKHPCEKPQALLTHIIRSSTRPGALVLDCFAGSGSTGEAALRLGRNIILIEKDPHWIEQSARRVKAAEAFAPVSDIRVERQKRERAKAQKSTIEQFPLFEVLTA